MYENHMKFETTQQQQKYTNTVNKSVNGYNSIQNLFVGQDFKCGIGI